VERIQRVSEAEVEQFGRRVGAGWISGDWIGIHWIWMGFSGILMGFNRTSLDFYGLFNGMYFWSGLSYEAHFGCPLDCEIHQVLACDLPPSEHVTFDFS
jgi:hypothetical protein